MNRHILNPLGAALMTALIIAGAYLSLPLEPPVVLANFFALLAGLLLGPVWGTASVLVYLVLGTLGLPVFAGGKGGIAILLGPTGGFLAGYLLMALAAGLLAGSPRKPVTGTKPNGAFAIIRLGLGGLAGILVLYAVGLPRFQAVLASKFDTLWAAAVYMFPYLLGDLAKALAAILIAVAIRPVLAQLGFGRDPSGR